MSTSMGVSGGNHPAHATWVTRLTFEDGHTEDVETAAGEDGSFTVTVPEGVVKAGPSWPADDTESGRGGGAWLTAGEAHGEMEMAPGAAPVTFIIGGASAGGGGGSR